MTQTTTPRLLKQYQRLVEVSRDLASNLELGSLLHRLMNVAVDLADAEEASILLYDQSAHKLYFETATNAESNPLLQKLIVPEESIAGWVAVHHMPQIINNVEQDQRHFTNVDQQISFNTRSMIAVPLITKQKLIGVLEVVNKKSGFFNDEDQEILLALGAQAAIAIENSRLFQQSDLIAEFVHELRTPLASILTASYLLERPEIPEPQRVKMGQTIHNEAQRLNELSTLFLDLARLQAGRTNIHITSFDPLPLLKECVEVIAIKAGEKNIQLNLEAPEPLPYVQGDRDKIKQVLLNLLNNAVKYNRPGGQVRLRARVEADQIFFSIQDTGVGIPPDQISQLFTRFFRARNVEQNTPGTGLGLSISQRIVEMHSGAIEVTSEYEVGTTFTVRLPIQQAAE